MKIPPAVAPFLGLLGPLTSSLFQGQKAEQLSFAPTSDFSPPHLTMEAQMVPAPSDRH
jgi:hypothetical protein